MIAVFLAVAIVNTAAAEDQKVNQTSMIIKLTYQQAIQSPGLVAAMRTQLHGGFLGGPGVKNITFRVTYQNHVYMITGSINQWTLFFDCLGITRQHGKSL